MRHGAGRCGRGARSFPAGRWCRSRSTGTSRAVPSSFPGRERSVHAAVRSIFPLRSLEVVRNGEVVARAEANGGRQAEINEEPRGPDDLSLIHISEPTRLGMISYAVFCLKKKKTT